MNKRKLICTYFLPPPRNIECGTIHCQGGIPKPLIPQSTYSSHTQTVNGQEVQCKVTSAMYSPETGGEDPGMVQDGTKCGDGMVSGGTRFIFKCGWWTFNILTYFRCNASSQS